MNRLLIAAAFLTFASTAQAQTSALPSGTGIEPGTAAATTAFAKSENGKKCKGRLAGRWRLYFSDPVTFCTVEIKPDGTVRKKGGLRTACRGVLLDHTAVVDGKVNRVAPLVNKHGQSNQCWIHGTIATEAGNLEIVEAFITKGSGSFSGVGIYLDGSASVVTGTRY